MAREWMGVLVLLAVLAVMLVLGTGCDPDETPAVHGVVQVDASPLPPFEVRFRAPSPTPVVP